MLFTFYQFNNAPVFFNKAVAVKAMETPYKDSLVQIEQRFNQQQSAQQQLSRNYILQKKENYKDSLREGSAKLSTIRKEYKTVLAKALPSADNSDTNYIFLRFVVDFLPKGLIGLLIAIIFLAAWGSIAAALNALASCTMIDFHLSFREVKSDNRNVRHDLEE